MNCQTCGAKMEATIEITGGCSGHSDPDDLCYCDSQDVHVEFLCLNEYDRSHKKTGNKNGIIKPSELSDQYSIARWITEHFNEKEK